MEESRVVAELERFLDEASAADRFSGAVLLARDPVPGPAAAMQPLFARAYGLASRAYSVPNRLDTRFNLGSMNKMFTAVAIAQLAEQGALTFADPIARHLPDYPRPAADLVTVHQLLTHTSGVGNIFTPAFFASARDQYRTVRDFFPFFAEEPLRFAPGTRWEYSNGGFVVLGAIIEAISGQTYFDYIRKHIFEAAGMFDTDAFEMDVDTPNLAVGYTHVGPSPALQLPADPAQPGPWRNNLFLHVVKGGPAGGGFSTVADLRNFARALRGHVLLSQALTDLVLTGHTAVPPPGQRYGYGFRIAEVRGARMAGHLGGFAGISAALDMYLDHGYTLAVLANYDLAALHVRRHVEELLVGPPPG